jgi:inorganic pyrophosphatase
LDELVESSRIKIDRPKGSPHPRFPIVYPFDYGYLEGSRSGDSGGIDVWIGNSFARHVTAIVCTADLTKRDAELKLLLGCSREQTQTILEFHNSGAQAAILVERS